MHLWDDAKHQLTIFILLTLLTPIGCTTVTEQLERTEKWVASLNKDSTDESVTREETVDPSSPSYTHTVMWSGESLSIVAKWYTGNLENWKTLAKVNPEIKPDFLRVGMKIRIPEGMIVNRTPMTQEFVASHYSKDGKRSKSRSSGADDVPLIGPKPYSDN